VAHDSGLVAHSFADLQENVLPLFFSFFLSHVVLSQQKLVFDGQLRIRRDNFLIQCPLLIALNGTFEGGLGSCGILWLFFVALARGIDLHRRGLVVQQPLVRALSAQAGQLLHHTRGFSAKYGLKVETFILKLA